MTGVLITEDVCTETDMQTGRSCEDTQGGDGHETTGH